MSEFSPEVPQSTDNQTILLRKAAEFAYRWATDAGAAGTQEPHSTDSLTNVVRKTAINLYQKALL